ncbi:MAG: hypothetical protein J4G19_05310 [Pseudomonadales bacterium]|nr:hypothetical protein [Pseudomonadales bacterium]
MYDKGLRNSRQELPIMLKSLLAGLFSMILVVGVAYDADARRFGGSFKKL